LILCVFKRQLCKIFLTNVLGLLILVIVICGSGFLQKVELGGGGGVLTGIKGDSFDIGSRVQGNFILQHTVWDKKLVCKWNLMNVYGAPQEENKDAFLAELASFCAKSKEPYIAGGDFNIIRFSF
jgi:hypothetical protein